MLSLSKHGAAKIAIAAGILLACLLTVLAFWLSLFAGIPQALHDRFVEYRIENNIHLGEDKTSVQNTLRDAGADWAPGHRYFELQCNNGNRAALCNRDVIEARFLRYATICTTSDEVLVIEFKNTRVSGTRKFENPDGC